MRAADLEAASADPLTRSFQAAVETTSLVLKPAEVPTDFPVVDGSEMVDIHCCVSSLCFRLV